jgi:glutathione S-transferase
MITLYYAPRTRAVRVRWLLEELGIPYALRRVAFVPPSGRFFSQATPLGKLPAIEDGEVTIGESGAILEYVIERYGSGRLAPPVGSPARARYLHWLHFAEGTLSVPLSTILWHTVYKGDAEQLPTVMADAIERAHTTLGIVEQALEGREYLADPGFSAADIMMGFTVSAARLFGLVNSRYPNLNAWLARLEARPAFQRATAD